MTFFSLERTNAHAAFIPKCTDPPTITYTSHHKILPHHNHIQHTNHAIHQLRGGGGGGRSSSSSSSFLSSSSSSDDIISTFKEELRKMRQELKREADMEIEATRAALQKKLGKRVLPPRSDAMDFNGAEDEGEEDENEYEYIEEEVEVVVDVDVEGKEDDQEDANLDEEEETVKEEDIENDIQMSSNEDIDIVDDSLESVHNVVDDEKKMGKNESQHVDTEEETGSDRDETETQVHMEDSIGTMHGVDGKDLQVIDDHDSFVDHIPDTQDQDVVKQKNVPTSSSKNMESLEIGESEEIDGNKEMSQGAKQKERVSKERKSKKLHTKTSKKGIEKKQKKKKQKKKGTKKPKSKKPKVGAHAALGTAESEQASSLHEDTSLAKEIARKASSTTSVSKLGNVVRVIAPTMIILVLMVLSHFVLDAILKQVTRNERS